MGIVSRSLAVAGLAAASGLAWPVAPAAAQAVPGQEVSRRLFDEGVELENAKSFAAALGKFREAEQIRATPALRYHKGFCLENLGKLAAALDEYEAAERTARDQNKQETLKSAQGRLAALRPRVPHLSVRIVSPKATEVLLDGIALAPPLVASGTKFRVDPGEHQISARAPDHVTKTITVSLAESASQDVDVTLERLSGGGAPPLAPTTAPSSATTAQPSSPTPSAQGHVDPPHAAEPKRSIALPLATTAGAVVLVAGGVAAFVLAGGAADDARADCPTKTSCDDERSKVRTFDALALGGFVAGAALGGLSTVLWLSKPSRAEATRPRLRVSAQGVFLEGAL